ncbi:MAG TPA: hypothetical protein IAB12_05440 [Candidatus Ornithospirochaeta avicola]|uniref:Haloacid dehalogenase n=1 Tax=Candidatus Ornithospirochaeta avicola TaxID=2840896 RepID=A0A9D1PTB8_9SPIO|nr:hypothetical protein [Candidatus Ornithospirochaeta avicola]
MSKVFLFDCGNVIVRNIDTVCMMASKLSLPFSAMHELYLECEARLFKGEVKEEDYYRIIEERFDVRVDENLFYTCFNPVLNDSVVSLASRLKNDSQIVAMATNSIDTHFEKIRALWPFLDDIFTYYPSHIIGKKKPDEDYYDYIRVSLGSEYSQMVLVDDLEENINSALSLGMKAFRYSFNDRELESFLSAFEKEE